MDKIATKPYRFCMAPSVESNCSHRQRSHGTQTKKVEALDFQGLPCGGDSWTRTNGRASLGRLTQAPLALAPHDVNDVLCDSWTRTNGRASLGRLTQAPLALAPHDVNDVLYRLSHATTHRFEVPTKVSYRLSHATTLRFEVPTKVS